MGGMHAFQAEDLPAHVNLPAQVAIFSNRSKAWPIQVAATLPG
jgi:hypothetical protein